MLHPNPDFDSAIRDLITALERIQRADMMSSVEKTIPDSFKGNTSGEVLAWDRGWREHSAQWFEVYRRFHEKWMKEADAYSAGSMLESPVGDMNRASAGVIRSLLMDLKVIR